MIPIIFILIKPCSDPSCPSNGGTAILFLHSFFNDLPGSYLIVLLLPVATQPHKPTLILCCLHSYKIKIKSVYKTLISNIHMFSVVIIVHKVILQTWSYCNHAEFMKSLQLLSTCLNYTAPIARPLTHLKTYCEYANTVFQIQNSFQP